MHKLNHQAFIPRAATFIILSLELTATAAGVQFD
jgi:hypothetical protein